MRDAKSVHDRLHKSSNGKKPKNNFPIHLLIVGGHATLMLLITPIISQMTGIALVFAAILFLIISVPFILMIGNIADGTKPFWKIWKK